MKAKRILTLALSVCTLLTCAACGKEDEKKISYPTGTPTISSGKEMFIGAFCSPYPTDEAYKLVAECGINNMVLYSNAEQPQSSPIFYKDPFDFGKKYGVNIIPNTHNQPWTVYKGQNYQKRWETYENYGGMNVFDEPSAEQFATLKKNLAEYEETVGKPYYINLFPNYANSEQLGTATYEEYVEKYTNEILLSAKEGNRYMVCDIYPLLKQGQLYGKWLSNLEVLQRYTKKADAEMYIYIQSVDFSSRRRPTSAADFRFQSYVSMAYGATGIYHFTYMIPFWDSMYSYSKALVDKDGVPTESYAFAKEVNLELLKLDDVFLDFDWKAAIHTIGSLNYVGENDNFSACEDDVKNYGALKKVEAEQDTIVGCFENADGYQGFMAVNFTDPTLKKTDAVTLTFGGGVNKAIVYTAGEPQTVALENGKYTFTLAAGEGNFIVPYKE